MYQRAPGTSTQRKQDRLERELARLESELARLESLPKEPDYGDEPVLLFWQKQFGGAGLTYSYAALKIAADRWVVTGRSGNRPGTFTWEELLDFIASGSHEMPVVWVATHMEQLI